MSCPRSLLRRAHDWRLSAIVPLVLSLLVFSQPNANAQTAPPSSGTVSVVRLNVRSDPSMTGAIVGRLDQNDSVTITGVSDDGDWLQVQSEDVAEGWVFADYVATAAGAAVAANAATNPLPAATATQTATVAADAGADPIAQVISDRINVRSGPGTNYQVVSSANKGAQLPITGRNQASSWVQVTVAGLNEPGWVMASLTTLVGALDDVPIAEAAAAPAAAAASTTGATAGATTAAAPVVAPSSGTGFGYGITASLWQGDKQGSADLIKQMGFGWVKQQVRWEYAEPSPGAINWQEMDDIVNTMNNNGINVMFSVVTSPPWARPTLGGTGGPPEDFQLFANFVGAIAGRYCGRVQAIEVWNEQNLRREWEGFPLEPASYMDLLKRAYNAIKGACPALLVISGATTPAGYSDVAFDDIDYLRGMYQNGLRDYSDGVGIHPSGFANPPSVRFEDWQSGNYDALSHVNHRSFYFLSTLEQSRRVMEENGDSAKKLWPTEFGWGSTSSPFPGYEYEARISEGAQAQWITQAFTTMRDSGYVAVPMLWNLNYPRDTEMGAFAVVGRPAFDALRQMMGR